MDSLFSTKYIMRTTFYIIIFFLAGCTSKSQKGLDSELPILDLSQNYPEIELDIHEIADVEYVPLETTDSSVIGMGLKKNISEKYIITSDPYGPVFIFDRGGKHLQTIHGHGQGPEEYNMIYGLAVDFKKEEYFVNDYNRKKIQVYDFKGKWKYNISYPKGTYYTYLFNLNEQYLIGVNEFHDTANIDNLQMDRMPYHLIDKNTSVCTPLPITIDRWISKTLERRIITENKITTMESTTLGLMPRLWANSYDFFISEFSKDTLYNYKDGQLSPLAIRYPSVDSYDTPVVISPIIYADNFLLFKPVELRLDKDYVFAPYDEAPLLMWNRKTNEIQHITRLYDSNRGMRINSNMQYERSEQPNCFISTMATSQLCEEYEEGKLKGKLKDVVSKLKEDDNDVIAIYKIK